MARFKSSAFSSSVSIFTEVDEEDVEGVEAAVAVCSCSFTIARMASTIS